MNPSRPSISEHMHQAAAPIWEACLNHPFVRGIGNGSLPLENFQYFMLQDYLYLLDYSRVFALGAAKARRPELMMRFARSLNSILNGEMEIHRGYLQRLGVSEAQFHSTKPALDSLSYTSYMLAIAHNGTSAEIVAAVLACSWSYAEIGQALAAIPGAAEHPLYGEWIQGYASESYAVTNQDLIELMDKLAADADEEEFAHLTDIFVNCSRYELEFWNMAWEMRA